MSEGQIRRIPFKVDIANIIELMGTSLYSRADTPVRELIQNAADAVMRRRRTDLSFEGSIRVLQDPEEKTISVIDDGVGLTPEEAERYLGTLGIGITGMIKRGEAPESARAAAGAASDLIGQFGIGLFSGFMLADRIVVESRRTDAETGVRWAAGAGTEIELCECDRTETGTCVTLQLKPEYGFLATQTDQLEGVIHEYADFLPVPIYLNDQSARVNLINAAWLEATPDRDAVLGELESRYNETPMDIIPIRVEKPVSVAGVLAVSSQRVPGFSETGTVMVTIRRMIISRNVRDLVPEWATFLRGVLELHDCAPTASREDLVRNPQFDQVRTLLTNRLYEYFEELADEDTSRLEAIIAWHRYTFAGAALEDPRLRQLLRRVYKLPTSAGELTINEIIERSAADPMYESDADVVVWYNPDRRQEHWMNQLFRAHDAPCVHTFRSFEESLLAMILADENQAGTACELRPASPGSPNFAESVIGMTDLSTAEEQWQTFLDAGGARIMTASWNSDEPVVAFLNERYELSRTFADLKEAGRIPEGFQRLIDRHFAGDEEIRNEVVLNLRHPMVSRALSRRTGTPLSSVLRLLVQSALTTAGAAQSRESREQSVSDLDWIAEALWGRDE